MDLVMLAPLLASAAWFDLRQRRIPNRLVAGGLLMAWLVSVLAGQPPLAASLLGSVAGLLVLLPFFATRCVGAGDVKLMAVVGGFVGFTALWPITLFTFIAGGLLALGGLAWKRNSAQAMRNFRTVLYAISLRAQGAPIAMDALGLKSALRLPYSLAIAAGVVTWAVYTHWIH